ncbi:MAG: ribonuclease III [Candidatus Izemoplasmatales bacterium]
MSKNIKELEMMFDLKFKNYQLLERALTHSSYANENGCLSNERLEFIGDAVIDLIVGKFFYDNIPESEGILTKKRAQEVCEDALYNYAKSFNLGDYLMLGKGEEQSGGREKPALLADAFEAFVGAIYVDSGLKEVYKVTEKVVFPVIINNLHKEDNDYKSKLQELLQSDKRSLKYEIISESGPPHDRVFVARVYMDESIIMGEGKGKSKKESEQNAAFATLQKLANNKEK